MAVSGGMAYVGWCGPCDNAGFARGLAVGKVNDVEDNPQLGLRGRPPAAAAPARSTWPSSDRRTAGRVPENPAGPR
ncbi:hypothetical protein DKT68_07140 [Micromonospora acroterricola]|uniref:Uncharacterized protein n=1 Tax=Micromonospora acroterricola TaxID=2202421 RepID=A0A317D833_9ACTN|nr:hypothetical protein DKT68_07140 [Micromonospora acroterricola]